MLTEKPAERRRQASCLRSSSGSERVELLLSCSLDIILFVRCVENLHHFFHEGVQSHPRRRTRSFVLLTLDLDVPQFTKIKNPARAPTPGMSTAAPLTLPACVYSPSPLPLRPGWGCHPPLARRRGARWAARSWRRPRRPAAARSPSCP